MTASDRFDVIVIGAGPAGLACAHALAGHRVLVLEREAAPGGRIRSVDLGRQRVDLGACFACDPAPLALDPPIDFGARIEERGPLVLHGGGRAFTAATPWGCLQRMGLDDTTLREIEATARLGAGAPALTSPRAAALLEALLHQVHPGDLADYAARHWRDGLFSWFPDHWEHGNAGLTDALLARSGAECLVRAEARRIVVRGPTATVSVDHEGVERSVRAGAVVVATTADVAARLVGSRDAGLRRWLGATRYAPYLVVALAGPAAAGLPGFRALVPADGDGAPATVVQQRSADRQRAVLLSYFRGPQVADLAAQPDPDLIAHGRSRLVALGIDRSALDALTEGAVQRWPLGGTLLSDDHLRWRARVERFGTGRIVLAGDYACDAGGAGYGVADALKSGLRAARDVRAVLGS